MNGNESPSISTRSSINGLTLTCLVLLVSISLLLSFGSSVRAETPEFVDAFHDPDEPDKDDAFEMTLMIDQVENVTGVEVYVCTITEGQCYSPLDMESSDNETWTVFNAATLKAGHTYGYKFLVETSDGDEVEIPDKNNLSDYDSYSIVELSGAYYFGFEVQSAPEAPDDDGGLPAPGLPLMLIGMSLALALRRIRATH